MTDADLAGLANVASFPLRAQTVPEPEGHQRRRYRTIWISDVHLGTKGCNAALLIDFLDHTDSETMYLVGDIIDGWRLKKKLFWPPEHNDIVWRILKRARRGTRVVYILTRSCASLRVSTSGAWRSCGRPSIRLPTDAA
jgi:hypothetical protein